MKTKQELLRHESDRATAKKVAEQIDALIDALNCMTGERAAIAGVQDQLRRTHRTLQQEFFKSVIIPAIEFFAWEHENGFTDPRNEATCAIAAKLWPMLKDENLPFI